VIVLIQY